MISHHYEHRPEHYRFQRTTTQPPQPSQPFRGYGYDLLSLATVAAVVGLLWFMCAVMAQ